MIPQPVTLPRSGISRLSKPRGRLRRRARLWDDEGAWQVRRIIIGTRGSSLAMCQAQIIQILLEERFPRRRFALKKIRARADQDPEAPLAAMSGEGIFVKELEAALTDGNVDLAVHSMKDIPLHIPSGICLAAILKREDARDALLSRTGQGLRELPAGSRIGTSSPRRRGQLLALRRDIEIIQIRGNVDTRLRKLDEGRCDAIVLAACGLIRLGLKERITQYLGFEEMLPEPGQGALGIEARANDEETLEMLQALDDLPTRACVEAERSFLRALGGGCRVPIAAYAEVHDGTLTLQGAVIAPDGSRMLRDQATSLLDSPTLLGEELATRLITQGATELLTAETQKPL